MLKPSLRKFHQIIFALNLVEYKENGKRYAVKVEPASSDYALVTYEANVTLKLHGIYKRERYT